MVRKIFKKASAMLIALCCMLSCTIYASASFNPTYSGKFVATAYSYMTISSSDAIMTKIIYPISATTNRFVTISNADSLIFSSSLFSATYSHEGTITDVEGSYVGTVAKPVVVQTSDITVTKGLLGTVKSVRITYNNIYYDRSY